MDSIFNVFEYSIFALFIYVFILVLFIFPF